MRGVVAEIQNFGKHFQIDRRRVVDTQELFRWQQSLQLRER